MSWRAAGRSLLIWPDLLPPECLVSSRAELMPFETDAFVSYRRMPLAVALPRSTAEVAAVMKYYIATILVVPRGAGTRSRAVLSRRRMCRRLRLGR